MRAKDVRIPHSSSEALYKGETQNHVLEDPCVSVVFGGAQGRFTWMKLELSPRPLQKESASPVALAT